MSPSATPSAYIAQAAPLAQEAMRKTGIPASVLIAQSALESGWGQSDLARNGRNYFGMTVGSPSWAASDPYWGGDSYQGGRFRAYATVRDSFLDFARGFYTNPRYAPALAFRTDPSAFVLA
ncbi:MAG TPA: glucosaminidase domain-containing protein, partial [Gammaproteobacteria bacterium]|nr:glucosaminidase domain-containing protein [Gammaproteobacteria bacterium]